MNNNYSIDLLSTNFIKKNLVNSNYLSLYLLQKGLTNARPQDKTTIQNINLNPFCFAPSMLQINSIIFDSINDDKNICPITINHKTFMTNSIETNIQFLNLIKSPNLKDFSAAVFSNGEYKNTKWIRTTKDLTVNLGAIETISKENISDIEIPYYYLLDKSDVNETIKDSNINLLCQGVQPKTLNLVSKIATNIDCSNLQELNITLPQVEMSIPEQDTLLPFYNGEPISSCLPKQNLKVVVNNNKIDVTSYLNGLNINHLIYTTDLNNLLPIFEEVKEITFSSNNFNLLIPNEEVEGVSYNYNKINLTAGEDIKNNFIGSLQNKIAFPFVEQISIGNNINKVGMEIFKYCDNLKEITINSSNLTSPVIIDKKAFQVNHRININIPYLDLRDIEIVDNIPAPSERRNALYICIDSFPSGSNVYYKGKKLLIWSNLSELILPFKYKDIENFKTYYQLSQIQDLYKRQD